MDSKIIVRINTIIRKAWEKIEIAFLNIIKLSLAKNGTNYIDTDRDYEPSLQSICGELENASRKL